ncbi:metallo-beta-lactamase superfamily protein [Cryphonectria parasitica EP155]|uniref:Metallo-beta-lactamase superfamily protein n=1 Tax=Cryphonectria parasitica (strain ATCC 38755 / EP155) TaxID=660469 RepID=A0A9P5CLL7_CRYP1|nr:metallo-beta-lactamase superfamily protein [Cryphonectria parasitica EP155]KAF3763203.1 metallo-beta-lactamase superfamily protein [Cryphonectria parasitica EP155]
MAPGKGGYRQINKALNICAFEDYLESQTTLLPPLEDVEHISPRVIRVLGQNPGKFTLQGTNTYIIGTGTERLIVDTGQGIPDWADLISAAVSKGNFTISSVLLTHWHGDHTGGVPDLIRMYPHLAGSIYKHTPSKTQKPIVNGQVFKVEGATVRAVHAPGHSHDHMCFILDEDQAMFTGDNVLGHGTAAVEHLSIWMATLRQMQTHGCKQGYPAHGAVIPDLTAKINGELAGKVRRERQVLQALQKQANEGGVKNSRLTTKEIVTAVYGPQITEDVRKMALEPFIDEVLRKLAEDGMVGFQLRDGVKKWFSIC